MTIVEMNEFFEMIVDDPRIGPVHISVYMALVHLLKVRGREGQIFFFNAEVMRVAKISGKGTFRKVMRDLHSIGYISYEVSFNPAIGSKVVMR